MAIASRNILVLQRALTSPTVQRLYHQASEKQGLDGRVQNIFIEFVPDECLFSGALADYPEGKILLGSSTSDEDAITNFVFELTKILEPSKLNAFKIHRKIIKQVVSELGFRLKLESETLARKKLVLRSALTNPSIQQLYLQACEVMQRLNGRDDFISIEFVPDEYLPFASDACVDIPEGEIFFRSSLSDEKTISNFVLKLTSILQSSKCNETVKLFRPIPAERDNFVSRNVFVLRRALTSLTLQRLYYQASEVQKLNGRVQSIFIEFVPYAYLAFDARADYVNGKILLRSSLSDEEAISVFVFELTNVLQSSKFDETLKRIRTDYALGSEYFVKSYEQIEYDGCKMHHQLIQKVASELGLCLTPEIDPFKLHALHPFETIWPSIQRTKHAHNYRQIFRARVQKRLRAACGGLLPFIIVEENNSVFCPPELFLGTTDYTTFPSIPEELQKSAN